MIFSVDTLATLVIYFVPKFLAEELGNRLSVGGTSANESRRVSGLSYASESVGIRHGSAMGFQDSNHGFQESNHEASEHTRIPQRVVSFLDPSDAFSGVSGSNPSMPFTIDSPIRVQKPTTAELLITSSQASMVSLPESAKETSGAEAKEPEQMEDDEVGLDADMEDAVLLKRRIAALEERNTCLEKENELKNSQLYLLEEELALLKSGAFEFGGEEPDMATAGVDEPDDVKPFADEPDDVSPFADMPAN